MSNSRLNGNGNTPITRDAGVAPNGASRAVYDEFKRMYEAEQVLSLKDLIQMLRRRLWVIVLTAVLLMGLAAGYTWSQTPIYMASVNILVTSERDSETAGDLQSQAMGVQALMPTITEMAVTYPVARDVAQRLDLSRSPESLMAGLSIEQSSSTSQFFQVSYADPDPEDARLIANSVGNVLSEHISDTNPSAGAVDAMVWERAELPNAPVSPDPLRNVLLALVFGLMLGAGLAFLLEYLDDEWRSPDEVEQALGVPLLGGVPSLKAQRKNRRKPFWR